jgi:hypothetical protein
MQVSNGTLAFAIVMVMNQPRAKVKASRYLSADASGRGKSKGSKLFRDYRS